MVAVVLGETSNAKRTIRAAALLEYGFRMRDWKSLFPAPVVESLPESTYDRELVRTANLTSRYKDCVAPVPEEKVAAAGDPAKAAATGPDGKPITTAAVTPDKTAAPAKRAKSKGNRTAKSTSKRRSTKKRASEVEAGAQFSLATP